MECAKTEEFDTGLCYTPCQAPSIGSGPTCWGNCPNGTFECGAACLNPRTSCSSYILEMITGSISGIVDIVTHPDITVAEGTMDVMPVVAELSFPVCPTF